MTQTQQSRQEAGLSVAARARSPFATLADLNNIGEPNVLSVPLQVLIETAGRVILHTGDDAGKRRKGAVEWQENGADVSASTEPVSASRHARPRFPEQLGCRS